MRLIESRDHERGTARASSLLVVLLLLFLLFGMMLMADVTATHQKVVRGTPARREPAAVDTRSHERVSLLRDGDGAGATANS